MNKEVTNRILEILSAYHKDAKCELKYKTNFELLVAVILSAQCTDKRVNMVTKELFKKYNKPIDFINATQEEIETEIYSTGFYKNKAKNIIAASKTIIEKYNGVLPNTREELEKLPGVGRKTANVVYSEAFGGDAIAVDTHVYRTSNRIGLAKSKNVLDTEKQLMKLIPQKDWSHFHHVLIFQGRYVCTAQSPKCAICPIYQYCNWAEKNRD